MSQCSSNSVTSLWISLGFSHAEIRELVHEYSQLPHGQKSRLDGDAGVHVFRDEPVTDRRVREESRAGAAAATRDFDDTTPSARTARATVRAAAQVARTVVVANPNARCPLVGGHEHGIGTR